jgi:hypothetical protein
LSKAVIVFHAPLLGHGARMPPRDVTHLLVPLELSQTLPLSLIVQLAHEALLDTPEGKAARATFAPTVALSALGRTGDRVDVCHQSSRKP